MSKPPEDGHPEPVAEEEAEERSITRELTRIEEATVEFYEAFASKDVGRMERLWSRSPYARCVHPGWEPVVGWSEIRQSWVDIFQTMESIRFTLDDIHVEVSERGAWVNLTARAEVVADDGEAFETTVVATNIFEMSEGSWSVVLHHSSHCVDDDEIESDGIMDEDLSGANGGFEEAN